MSIMVGPVFTEVHGIDTDLTIMRLVVWRRMYIKQSP